MDHQRSTLTFPLHTTSRIKETWAVTTVQWYCAASA